MSEIVAGIIGSALGGVVSVVLYCELGAWARDACQQRRFDGWHRRRWVALWSARLGLGPHEGGDRPAARVRDVASPARDIRWSRWRTRYVLPMGIFLFWPALVWLVWRWWQRSRMPDAPARAPEVNPRRPGRSTPRSLLLRIVSGFVFALALIVFLTMSPPPSQFEGPYAEPNYSGVMIGGVLLALSVLAYRGSRRATLLPASETMTNDPRPAVLYLRSFGDDRLRMRAHRAGRHSVVDRLSPVRRDFIEEIFAEMLWSYGPVLAVAQPGIQHPPLGAAREQLPNLAWRTTVEQRMRDATLIVVMVGRTAGLAWEIETLGRLGMWHKVLWLFPPVSTAELECRWSATLGLLGSHGGPISGPDVELGETLVATSPCGRDIVSYVSRRRNDWSYEAALHAAVADLPRPAHAPPLSAAEPMPVAPSRLSI